MAKTSVVHRVIAKLIDLAVFALMAAIIPRPAGPLIGFLYSICADGMMNGRSVGKRMLKLRVRSIARGGPCSLKESVLRNAPVGVATFFSIIPLWGWLILGLIGLPLMAIEVYLMLTVDTGHRLGDVMADTEVVQ